MERDLEDMIRRVVEEILGCERPELPGARLIGRAPGRDLGYRYVETGPYEAVVVGSLSPGELLHFPDEVSMNALLEGKPVLLCEDGLEYRKHRDTCNRGLYSRLLSAERQLKQMGVEFIGPQTRKILTAGEVRRRLKTGQPIEGRLTPLAKDILESEQQEGSK